MLVLCTLTVTAAFLYLGWRERQHDAERSAWTRERAALLERITGVTILPPEPEQKIPRRAYGTDADEWAIEQERLGNHV